jgi:hypothetical protein
MLLTIGAWGKPQGIRLRAVGTGSSILDSNMIDTGLLNVLTAANHVERRTAQWDQILFDWTPVEQLIEGSDFVPSPVRLRKSPPSMLPLRQIQQGNHGGMLVVFRIM